MPRVNLPRSLDKCASLGRWFMRTRLVARRPGRIPSALAPRYGFRTSGKLRLKRRLAHSKQVLVCCVLLPRHHPSRRSLRSVDADIRPLFEPARMIIKATSLATCETIVVQSDNCYLA